MRIDHITKGLPNRSLVITSTTKPPIMSHDVSYPYHPSRHFWYLCQVDSWPAVIAYENINNKWLKHLFLAQKDERRLLWEGDYLYYGHPNAYQYADHVHELSNLDHWLSQNHTHHVYVDPNDVFMHEHLKHRDDLKDLNEILFERRLIKQPQEISLIKNVCEISALCHNRLLEVVRPGMSECTLEGHFILEGHKHGLRQQAYPPIVAGQQRACILHYTQNNHLLEDGDLVLVDAGWVNHGFCADITRTFPVNGKFTAPQLDLYNCVLNTQLKTMQLLEPGITWPRLRDYSYKCLAKGLYDLDIFKTLDESLEKTRKYFPHGIGHWIGLDVHDPCPYTNHAGNPIEFVPGMTLTIEPGLYFPAKSPVPKHFQGIGIRIEDNCLITQDGFTNLTAGAVKDPDAIMTMMGQK